MAAYLLRSFHLNEVKIFLGMSGGDGNQGPSSSMSASLSLASAWLETGYFGGIWCEIHISRWIGK